MVEGNFGVMKLGFVKLLFHIINKTRKHSPTALALGIFLRIGHVGDRWLLRPVGMGMRKLFLARESWLKQSKRRLVAMVIENVYARS